MCYKCNLRNCILKMIPEKIGRELVYIGGGPWNNQLLIQARLWQTRGSKECSHEVTQPASFWEPGISIDFLAFSLAFWHVHIFSFSQWNNSPHIYIVQIKGKVEAHCQGFFETSFKVRCVIEKQLLLSAWQVWAPYLRVSSAPARLAVLGALNDRLQVQIHPQCLSLAFHSCLPHSLNTNKVPTNTASNECWYNSYNNYISIRSRFVLI